MVEIEGAPAAMGTVAGSEKRAARRANGWIDVERLANPLLVGEYSSRSLWRPDDPTPCRSCGHALGAHLFPAEGRVYWVCFAPDGTGQCACIDERPEIAA